MTGPYRITDLQTPEDAANMLRDIAREHSANDCITFIHGGETAVSDTIQVQDAASYLANYFQSQRPHSYESMSQQEMFTAIGQALHTAGVGGAVEHKIGADHYNPHPMTNVRCSGVAFIS